MLRFALVLVLAAVACGDGASEFEESCGNLIDHQYESAGDDCGEIDIPRAKKLCADFDGVLDGECKKAGIVYFQCGVEIEWTCEEGGTLFQRVNTADCAAESFAWSSCVVN